MNGGASLETLWCTSSHFSQTSVVVGSIDLNSAGPGIESRLECWLNYLRFLVMYFSAYE